MDRLTHASIELHGVDRQAGAGTAEPGGLKLYRSRDTFLRDRLERELLERCGVRHRLLEDEIYQYEPDLKRVFAQGVLIEDSLSIRDPGELCRRYAQMFVDAGGRVERAAVQSLRPAVEGWEIASDQGRSRPASWSAWAHGRQS